MMSPDQTDFIKRHLTQLAVFLGIVAPLLLVGYECGKRSQTGAIADLTTKLAENEKTVEIKDGLYATKVVELKGLTKLLEGSSSEITALKKQLSDSNAQLLTTQQLVVTWKKAYQGALASTQTTIPPDNGANPTERKRVDFSGDLGPIHASGHTLTDPPETDLTIQQIRPLKLTVAVAKNKDGTWSSYVTSSEPDVGVDVTLAGVDQKIIDPTWKQRIWLDFDGSFLGGFSSRAGLSYHFDRWSIGPSCSVWKGGAACGASVGIRLFE